MPAESWKTIFDVSAVVLLFLTFAAGAGGFVFGNIINKRQSAQLRQFDNDLTGAKLELGKQQERAANAERSAADAKSTAEKFQLEIAEANARAAEAQLALERLKAPRILNDTQVKAIAALLKEYPGQEYELEAVNDREPLSLAQGIITAVNHAGWKRENVGGFLMGFLGLRVAVQANALARTKEAAHSLTSALRQQGLTAEFEENSDSSNTPNGIRIVVGNRM
jgi:hypothetical protein